MIFVENMTHNPKMVENRDKGLYRGLERCAANWHRLRGFCQREKLDLDGITESVCKGLKHFFRIEVYDVITLGKPTSVNCSTESLIDFFAAVGVDMADLPKEWQRLNSYQNYLSSHASTSGAR
jgi:hypothetical protein